MSRSIRKALVILAAAIVMTCLSGCGSSGEALEETSYTAQITETSSAISGTYETETELEETSEMTEAWREAAALWK